MLNHHLEFQFLLGTLITKERGSNLSMSRWVSIPLRYADNAFWCAVRGF